MATKSKARNTADRRAIATGKTLAAEAIRVRDAALRRRARNIRRAAAQAPAGSPVRSAAAAPARASLGVLVAEGDSWFDYPGRDVLSALDDRGYDIVSVAHAGHTAEAMAYSDTQLVDFVAEIDRLLRRNITPKAILLSAGGNDMAGDEFAMLINHRLSPIAGLNDAVVQGVVDQRVRTAYITILTKVTEACRQRTGQVIPIILHGYGWAVPDGRGFLGGALFLPGPWLEPGFRVKGFDRRDATQFDRMKNIVKDLVNRFNTMVAEVAAMSVFASHVHYVDLRPLLPNDNTYKTWWANELHPKDRGFDAVADKYAQLLAGL